LTEREFTKILDWPGYRVYRHEIDEKARTLKLWVRRKRGNKVLTCSGCGGRCSKIEEIRQREVRICRGASIKPSWRWSSIGCAARSAG
jgi:hypothetical protein